MTPQGLRLFWSMPPQGQRSRPDLRRAATGDWLNLEMAGVSGVMLPLWLAWQQWWIVEELAAGGRKVILRVLDEDLHTTANQVRAIQGMCDVELVIVRNEVDRKHDLIWGGAWGNEPGGAAEGYRDDLERMLAVLGGVVALASGAFSCRNFREDDPPQPGLLEWTYITKMVANRFRLNAVHAYQHGWASDVDRVMMKSRLQLMAGLHHKGLVLSEFGVSSPAMTQQQKASAYIEILRWLCDPEWPTGERYVMAIPFCSTGSEEWRRAGYVLDDLEVYRWFGDFAR